MLGSRPGPLRSLLVVIDRLTVRLPQFPRNGVALRSNATLLLLSSSAEPHTRTHTTTERHHRISRVDTTVVTAQAHMLTS